MRVLSISAKCSDLFSCALDDDTKTIFEYDGYVPSFFPEDHYGDYIMFDIDIDTGKIINWKKPTQKQLKELSCKQN